MRFRLGRAIALGALALSMSAAACGSDSNTEASDTTVASAGGADVKPAGTLRLGYFANVTHAPALIGEEQGFFAEALGDGAEVEYRVLQRRHRGHRGAVRRRDRRHVHRPEPGDQRLRPVRAARRCASSPASPRAARRSSSVTSINAPERPRGQDAGDAVSSATPRTSPCGPGWRQQGYKTDETGGGDVVDPSRRPTPTR